jgi:hypothetical protein
MPFQLYINPSQVTCLPRRKSTNTPTEDRTKSKNRSNSQKVSAQQNLKDNAHTGKISIQTKRKMSLAIQWLVYLAEKKKVVDPDTMLQVDYRVGLMTVSLPTGCEDVTPKFFIGTLLNQLIDDLNYKFKLSNYVWKIELQKRGALHAHITVDQYIPHKYLRKKWCELLSKHGLMHHYTERFQSMTVKEYIHYRKETDHANYRAKFKSYISYIKSYIKSYQYGVATNWQYPNCTDIHSVKNIKNLAGYMVKYLGKDPGMMAGYKGRVWSTSHALSRLRSVSTELPPGKEPKMWGDLTRIARDTYEKLIYNRYRDDVQEFLSIWYLPRQRAAIDQVPWLKSLFQNLSTMYHTGAIPRKFFVDWNSNFQPIFVTLTP